ncbi:MAG: carboxypeptidase Taq [Cognaticolwellia sp.]|jgi:carboxypeptidase Taq
MNKQYESYKNRMRKIADINGAISVMAWDKEVNLPKNGAAARSQQMATLSGMAHELFTAAEFGKELEGLMASDELTTAEYKNVTLTLKDYNRSTKLPTEYVIRRSEAVSEAYHAWMKAREANDFGIYKDALKKIIAIAREAAELFGYEDHPYDALLDMYEPNAKTADLTILFKDVREQLVNFVKVLKEKPQVENSFLSKFYEKDKQWDFGLGLLKNMGYDFDAGRQDISTHPFTITFAPTDVRVTTRVDENDLSNMIWSCIHEGGHGLYEQGLKWENYGLPIGEACSLGIHESQARMWENNVGRSHAYWQAHYSGLQQVFPNNLSHISLKDFYNGMNQIAPNAIRTEADELHYHFHVLIRFEIEKELMAGTLEVDDLSKVWNQKYAEYMGIEIKNDNEGILQDIHWSHGSIGYFPTYSLGSFYAAQFFAKAQDEIPNLVNEISEGDSSNLLAWLRQNIHQHGRYFTPEELCIKITGEKLNFKYFMDYAKQKFGSIYGI